jgi:hypothetical protein
VRRRVDVALGVVKASSCRFQLGKEMGCLEGVMKQLEKACAGQGIALDWPGLIHALTNVARAGAKYNDFGTVDNDVQRLEIILDDLTDALNVADAVQSLLRKMQQGMQGLENLPNEQEDNAAAIGTTAKEVASAKRTSMLYWAEAAVHALKKEDVCAPGEAMTQARDQMQKASKMCESICQDEKAESLQNFCLQPQMVFIQWCFALASLVQMDAIEGYNLAPNQKQLETILKSLANVGGHVESVDICGNLEVFFSRRCEPAEAGVFAALRNSLLPEACVDEEDVKEKSTCAICGHSVGNDCGVLLSLPCLHRVHENCCGSRSTEGYPACPFHCAAPFQSARLPLHLRQY